MKCPYIARVLLPALLSVFGKALVAQLVYPVFYSHSEFPLTRIYDLTEAGKVVVVGDFVAQIWDSKSQAFYGSVQIVSPENLLTRIRHVEFLKDLNQLAIVGEQQTIAPGGTTGYKDYLFIYDLSSLNLVMPPLADGMAQLIKHKYDRSSVLPAIEHKDIYQYYYRPLNDNLYTIDRAGEVDIYKGNKLEATLHTGAVKSDVLYVNNTGNSIFLADSKEDVFKEIDVGNGKVIKSIKLISTPFCRSQGPLYKEDKCYMVRLLAEEGIIILLDSVNRVRVCDLNLQENHELLIPATGVRVTYFDYDGVDSLISFIGEIPGMGCKTIAAATSLKTKLNTYFDNGNTAAGLIGYSFCRDYGTNIRIMIPGYGEHETDLCKLQETAIATPLVDKTKYTGSAAWEHGYVNMNVTGKNGVDIDVFQSDSVMSGHLLYSQHITLGPDEQLAGIRPGPRWYLTTTLTDKYSKGNMVLRVYDSTGRRLFAQTGCLPVQMLNSPFSAQQVFSEDGNHFMIKEFLGRVSGEDSIRLRVYNTNTFGKEADIVFTQVAGDVLTQKTAFFAKNSKGFFFTGLSRQAPGNKTVLFSYSLVNGAAEKKAEVGLCADPTCQLPVSVSTIRFTADDQFIVFSGIVNSAPPGQTAYVQVVRCIAASGQGLIWYLNLPAAASIRKILLFKGFVGLQTDMNIDFFKLTNGQFNRFLTLTPVTNTSYSEFSNLYVYSDGSSVPVYYERTGNESLVSFRMGTQSFKRSFFDLTFNRPDEIIAGIPGGDDSTRQRFYKAIVKRSGRIDKTIKQFDPAVIPVVTLVNTGYRNDDLRIRLFIKSRNAVQYIRVISNGNEAVKSLSGKEIPVAATGSGYAFEYDLYQPLVNGENRFEISVVDDRNGESVPLTVVQNDIINRQKPNLFVLILSVAKNTDTTLNVPWVLKDAEVMSRLFQDYAKDTLFRNVVVDTLYNEKVTAASIGNWLEKHRAVHPGDYVIVFFNGHGTLDVDKNLLLLSSETPGHAPFHNAIVYQDVLDKLESLPARQKLFLIDACFSGDLDKEEASSAPGQESSFDFLQEAFTFSSKGKGTFVFTSCAGKERSLGPSDKDRDKPGPFVIAIREALADRLASQDDFGRIWIEDFFKYVRARTALLSRLNRPNIKMNNPAANWRLK